MSHGTLARIGDHGEMLTSIPSTPMWSENMALMLNEKVGGITIFLHLGRWWANPRMLRGTAVVAMPGDRGIYTTQFGPLTDPTVPSGGGLTMEPIGNGRFRYCYDGPAAPRRQSEVAQLGLRPGPLTRLRLDLIFTPDTPMWDMADDPAEPGHGAGETAASSDDLIFAGGHMEHMGSVQGTLYFDGELIEITHAHAVRDHSRGVREFSKFHSHLWTQGRFADWGFYAVALRLTDSPTLVMNKVHIYTADGQSYAATVKTDAMLSVGDDIWRPFEMTFESPDHAPRTVRVTRMWNCFQIGQSMPADNFAGPPPVGIDHPMWWALEQSAAWESDGKPGIGHVERSNRDIVADAQWATMCTPEKIAG